MSANTTTERKSSPLSFWQSVLDPETARSPVTWSQVFAALAGIVLLTVFYGLAAGFFQGDQQILVSAFKIPLVVSATLLLCLPSLYVFAVLAGAQLTVWTFFTTVLGFAGRLSLFAFATLPIVWLFSVSSQYLFLMIAMHLVIWILSLALSRSALSWPGRPARGVVTLWLVLVFVVSLQLATVCRPVLLRPAYAPLFERGKVFFLEHFDHVAGKTSP